MRPRPIRLPGSRAAEPEALLDLPLDADPEALALLAHDHPAGNGGRALRHLSAALTDRGVGVLRLDLGAPDGKAVDPASFESAVDRVLAAAAHLADEREAPRVLLGLSLGGAAAIRAAPALEDVRAVVTIGAPADPEGVEEAAESLGRPLLLLHAPADEVVGVEHAARLLERARHPKSLLSLDGADHHLSDDGASRWAASAVAAWVGRYLPGREAESPEELERDTQVLVETGGEGFLTRVRSRHHTFLADEPEAVGGTGEGPTPYDLLVAALGTCTSMTLRMYADRKGWPLGPVRVRMRHHRIHAADCGACDSRDARLERIERRISLEGPLDADQRARLLEIAERCPVHRTLTSDLVIRTALDEG